MKLTEKQNEALDMACKMIMEDYYRIQLTKLPPEFKGHVL